MSWTPDLTACHFRCFWFAEFDDGCVVDPEPHDAHVLARNLTAAAL